MLWCREAKLEPSVTTRKKLAPFSLVMVLPPLQGGQSSLLECAQTEKKHALSIITPGPGPSPRVTNRPFPDPCKPFPLQKASYSSGRRGIQTTPRSPLQHWEAQSAPLGVPCQCWGSWAQGECSTFWSPPALTIPWLCCWEPVKMGAKSKSEALIEHKNLNGGRSYLA